MAQQRQDAVMALWLEDKLQARAIGIAEADRLWREHREKAQTAASNAANADGDAGARRG